MIHSTEGGTAASNARFFATTALASTHLVLDDVDTYKCVPELVIPWGAPGVNRSGLHIEHCGFAKWDTETWRLHGVMLDQSARRAAAWAWQYQIPRRWLTTEELRSRSSGFTTHAAASDAFNPGGHHDPGSGFPYKHYMGLVKKYFGRIVSERTEP